MTPIPIVEHFSIAPTPQQQAAVERLAEQLRSEQSELAEDEQFRPFVPDRLSDAPTLHLDDVSDIPMLDSGQEIRFMQDRARLRADTGDLVASVSPRVAGFEAYCRRRLQLGSVRWLRPMPTDNPLRIADACWKDRRVRRTLIRLLRADRLRYLHPHMGTFGIWELAALLHGASRRPVEVIAPTPALCRWVNNKVCFTDTVVRLFGQQFIPRTSSAWNFGSLAQQVAQFAEESEVIGLKLPSSGGGSANLVLDAARLRGRSLESLYDELHQLTARLGWDGCSRILIERWETQVVCTPSAQLWIPPEPDGLPVVEGLFSQIVEGEEGVFVGAEAARLPEAIGNEIALRCWLLARLYQRLGYIGRCSFDTILVGESLARSRLEFIECNGRWGGTSLPMTLMNRLFGDWSRQPFAIQVLEVPGLDRLTFSDLLEALGEELYDARTGRGRWILYNAGRIRYRSGISAIALGESWQQASKRARRELPERLRQVVEERAAGDRT